MHDPVLDIQSKAKSQQNQRLQHRFVELYDLSTRTGYIKHNLAYVELYKGMLNFSKFVYMFDTCSTLYKELMTRS